MFKIDPIKPNEEEKDHFELKTKTGNVWGSQEKIDNIKISFLQREEKKLDNRKRNLINFFIALLILILVIVFIILQKKFNWWF